MLCVILAPAIALFSALSGDVLRNSGWCHGTRAGLLVKQMVMFITFIYQSVLILLLLLVVKKTATSANRSVRRETYFRFFGIIATQLLSLGPILLCEMYAVSFKPVPCKS